MKLDELSVMSYVWVWFSRGLRPLGFVPGPWIPGTFRHGRSGRNKQGFGIAAIRRAVLGGSGTRPYGGTHWERDMATAAARLALYEAAEQEILEGGQAAEIEGNKVTRANLKEIRDMIGQLTAEIAAAASGSARNLARFRSRH